ncbi:TPA: NUDIX hydrolase [archaeon]|nr:NUDIX hydrolase [Candidatus Naiadarchaeales archaeon SRR2090153.bin1042]
MTHKKAVIAVVKNNSGKFLLGRKRRDSEKFLSGKWHIPGETLHDLESDVDGLKRCAREEAGIKIKVGKYLGSHFTPSGKLANWYECFAVTEDIRAGSDLAECGWFEKREVASICGERLISIWPEGVREYFGIN